MSDSVSSERKVGVEALRAEPAEPIFSCLGGHWHPTSSTEPTIFWKMFTGLGCSMHSGEMGIALLGETWYISHNPPDWIMEGEAGNACPAPRLKRRGLQFWFGLAQHSIFCHPATSDRRKNVATCQRCMGMWCVTRVYDPFLGSFDHRVTSYS